LTNAATAAADRSDLVQFLWSIDATTTEIPLATGFEGCPP
jgi:hypothetical protein